MFIRIAYKLDGELNCKLHDELDGRPHGRLHCAAPQPDCELPLHGDFLLSVL